MNSENGAGAGRMVAAAKRAAQIGRYLAPLPIRALQGQRYGRTFEATQRQPSDEERPVNPLEAYFDANQTGPGIWKWRHYFDVYHRHFGEFVGTSPTILEIGIYSGGSLGMWHSYFGEGTRVIGVDIEEDCRAYEDDSTSVYIGNQASPAFWRGLMEKEPKIDLVVDDGGHLPHQQIATLEALLPHLSPGGVFIVEDVTRRINPFLNYIHGLARNLNERRYGEPNAVQRYIDSIALYPYMTVITRRREPLETIESHMHGTEWQPFYAWRQSADEDSRTPTD